MISASTKINASQTKMTCQTHRVAAEPQVVAGMIQSKVRVEIKKANIG